MYVQAKKLEEDNAKLLEQLNALRHATADLETAAVRARAIRDDELRCVFVWVVWVWVWVWLFCVLGDEAVCVCVCVCVLCVVFCMCKQHTHAIHTHTPRTHARTHAHTRTHTHQELESCSAAAYGNRKAVGGVLNCSRQLRGIVYVCMLRERHAQ